MTDLLGERVGVLVRREIEARILRPLMERLEAEIGRERARSLLAEVIDAEARRAGEAMRERAAGPGDDDGDGGTGAGRGGDLRAFADGWEPWLRGGALELEQIRLEPDEWRFDVTRCRYAELYRSLGMEDLGATLSCRRDAALIEGYDPDVVFTRSQTIMEGATHCDFHYRRAAPAEDPEPPAD